MIAQALCIAHLVRVEVVYIAYFLLSICHNKVGTIICWTKVNSIVLYSGSQKACKGILVA